MIKVKYTLSLYSTIKELVGIHFWVKEDMLKI